MHSCFMRRSCAMLQLWAGQACCIASSKDKLYSYSNGQSAADASVRPKDS